MRSPPLYSGFSSFFLVSAHWSSISLPFQFLEKAIITSPRPCLTARLKSSSCAADAVDAFEFADSKNGHTEEIRRNLYGPVRFRAKEKRASLSSHESLKRYSRLLHDCVSKGSLSEGTVVHGNLIRNEVELDSHLWVSLISCYAKCGGLEYARKVLDVMPRRDVVSWTAVISGFVAQGYGFDGVNLFRDMRREGIKGNEFTLTIALKACCTGLDVESGLQVHAEAVKLGFLSDLYVGSALVELYAKCCEMELAYGVFFSMPEKNLVAWNVLLNGYAEIGDGKEVLNLFHMIKEHEMKFNKFTLCTVLKGFANSASAREGKIVHSLTIRIGYDFDELLSSVLVDMYSKCRLDCEALKVFKRIKHPDLVAWTSIIACLDRQDQTEEVGKLFNLMRCSGIKPNEFTLASIVSASAHLGEYLYGESIHACVLKHGFESDNLVGNALVTMYMRYKYIKSGVQMFDAMILRDSVSWNALLSGFCYQETCDQGPRAFYKMLSEGFRPTIDTFLSILKSCSSHSSAGFGKQVHAYIVKNAFGCNDFLQTALMDMYVKTGFLEDAIVCFNRLMKRDFHSWALIISGHAQSDEVEKTIEYFIQMQREGLKPNEFTLSACLDGCAHMKALETGCILHALVIKIGFGDDMIVATAITDLYGKCGSIKDAETIFESLVSRDTVSWNTIISVYSRYGQGEKALQAFRMMIDEGIVPDKVSLIGVVTACRGAGLIEVTRHALRQYCKKFWEYSL